MCRETSLQCRCVPNGGACRLPQSLSGKVSPAPRRLCSLPAMRPPPPASGKWPPCRPLLFQIEELIRQASQTLQLLIEHDPVSQRLDRLRLDSRLPAHLKKPLLPRCGATLGLKENLEGTLRRRSLRYLAALPRPGALEGWGCWERVGLTLAQVFGALSLSCLVSGRPRDWTVSSVWVGEELQGSSLGCICLSLLDSRSPSPGLRRPPRCCPPPPVAMGCLTCLGLSRALMLCSARPLYPSWESP